VKPIYRQWRILIGVLLLLGLTACGGRATPAGPQISVEDAWGRPSPKVATTGAFYMVIRNQGGEADRLLGGRSPACGTVELHESYKTAEGAMGMRPVSGGFVEIPAGGQAEFKPGGLHVMCIDKLQDFQPGNQLPLTLQFEKSGEVTVQVAIREQ